MIMMHFCLTYLEKETSLRNKIITQKHIPVDILDLVLEEVYLQMMDLLEMEYSNLLQERVTSKSQRILKV